MFFHISCDFIRRIICGNRLLRVAAHFKRLNQKQIAFWRKKLDEKKIDDEKGLTTKKFDNEESLTTKKFDNEKSLTTKNVWHRNDVFPNEMKGFFSMIGTGICYVRFGHEISILKQKARHK